jgi:mannose-6-phosphate isomerase-like protein (cupin superfamily)
MKTRGHVITPTQVPVYQAPPPLLRRIQILVDRGIGARKSQAGMYTLLPGMKTKADIHPREEEIYYVVKGRGRLVLDRKVYHVKPKDVIWFPPGVRHQSFNTGSEDLVYFWVLSPPPRGKYVHIHIRESWKKWKALGSRRKHAGTQ